MGAALTAELLAQKRAAIKSANSIKDARKLLLHRLYGLSAKASCLLAADMLEDVPDVLRTLTVDKFLQRVRKVDVAAPTRRCAPSSPNRVEFESHGWLTDTGIWPKAFLGELNESERASLASVLRSASRNRRRVGGVSK